MDRDRGPGSRCCRRGRRSLDSKVTLRVTNLGAKIVSSATKLVQLFLCDVALLLKLELSLLRGHCVIARLIDVEAKAYDSEHQYQSQKHQRAIATAFDADDLRRRLYQLGCGLRHRAMNDGVMCLIKRFGTHDLSVRRNLHDAFLRWSCRTRFVAE